MIYLDSSDFSNYEFNLEENAYLEINKIYNLGEVNEEVTINLNFPKSHNESPLNQVSEVEKELSDTINNTNPFSLNQDNNNENSLNENFEEDNENSDELGFDIF